VGDHNSPLTRAKPIFSGHTTISVFNQNGQRVSTWQGSTTTPLRGQYYCGSKPVVYYSGGSTHFQHQDWLGTERVCTTYNGSVESTLTSLPFGDGQTTDAGGDPNHFAALDYDAETGTDHAQFRQYNSTQGHWMRPDPYYGSYDLSNPQSMNQYVYALNNPLSLIDPSGQDVTVCDNQGNCYTYSDEAFNQLVANGYGAGLSVDGNGNIICSDGSVCGTISVSESITVSVGAGQMPIPFTIAPNSPPAKPPLTPQQKKQMICNTLGNVTGTLNRTTAVAGIVSGAARLASSSPALPIAGPIAAGAAGFGAATATLSGINTAIANNLVGCSLSYWGT
jgi:RHS repeat-associated protein